MEVQALTAEKGRAVGSGKALAQHMATTTSPFYAEVLRRQAAAIDAALLDRLLRNLRWADLKLKSTAIPPRTILEEALIASYSGQTLENAA
jgi:hypothetical protein